MRTILKGSPQWSIDTNGVITITTTWMCLIDEGAENVLTAWLNFQNEVEAFAGKPGDAYKLPVQSSDGVEVYSYTPTDAFVVQDVNYTAAEGRTHYEVTFTNIQNFSKMTLVGGIQAAVNENNERTKTATYRVNIGSAIIDTFMLNSGDVTEWAGTPYLIESSEYNPESSSQYIITIVAKDMSRMMIGLPQDSVDNYGNRTITATWRYSADVYDIDDLPKQGDDAKDFIGGKEGFVIQSIDIQPHGVLGYHVSITAVSHRTKQRISSSRRDTRDTNTNKFYTEWESQFQADSPTAQSLGNVTPSSLNASEFIPEGISFPNGTVREVSYDEYVTGKYNVRVSMSNQPVADSVEFEDTWDAQVSQSSFKLTLDQCGWSKSPSGDLYMTNFPPTTKFRYSMTPDGLVEMLTTSAINLHPSNAQNKILRAIQGRSKVGFDSVVTVQAFTSDGNLRYLTPSEMSNVTSLTQVQSIMLEGFVHAQPNMTVRGESERNMLFTPWYGYKSCPLWWGDDNKPWPSTDDRNHGLEKRDLSYAFQYHDIQVVLRYKQHIRTALKADISKYYADAIAKIKSSNYTSYKGFGIAYKSHMATDDYGDINDYTEVTCTIRALLRSNADSPIWNKRYDNSYIVHQG